MFVFLVDYMAGNHIYSKYMYYKNMQVLKCKFKFHCPARIGAQEP